MHTDDAYFDHPYFTERREPGPRSELLYAARLARIVSLTGDLSGLRVLEIGCDVGLFVEYMQRHSGARASGLDISRQAVEYGRARGRDLRVASLETADLEPGTFDVVLAYDLIEHVAAPKEFVTAARRALRPGGWLVLETPNYLGLTYRVGRLLGGVPGLAGVVGLLQRRLWPPFHVQYFTPSSLRRLTETTGFHFEGGWLRALDADELAVHGRLIRGLLLALFAIGRLTGSPDLMGLVGRA